MKIGRGGRVAKFAPEIDELVDRRALSGKRGEGFKGMHGLIYSGRG